MMRALLAGIATLPPMYQFLVFSALSPVLLPVVMFSGLLWCRRQWLIRLWLQAPATRCPRGHHITLLGPDVAWTCRCGFTYSGISGFDRCPMCQERAGFVRCACGASCPNPIVFLESS